MVKNLIDNVKYLNLLYEILRFYCPVLKSIYGTELIIYAFFKSTLLLFKLHPIR